MEDEALVKLLQEGNELAFKKFYSEYEEYFSRLARGNYGYLMKCIPLEDLLEDAFFVCVGAIKDYDVDKKASFKTFVTLCVTRSWLKVYNQRKRGNYLTISLDDCLMNDDMEYTYHDITADQKAMQPFEQMIVNDQYEDLIHYENNGKETQLYEVIRYKIMGYSINEISAKLDISPKKVSNLLYKARKMIKSRKNN